MHTSNFQFIKHFTLAWEDWQMHSFIHQSSQQTSFHHNLPAIRTHQLRLIEAGLFISTLLSLPTTPYHSRGIYITTSNRSGASSGYLQVETSQAIIFLTHFVLFECKPNPTWIIPLVTSQAPFYYSLSSHNSSLTQEPTPTIETATSSLEFRNAWTNSFVNTCTKDYSELALLSAPFLFMMISWDLHFHIS